MHVRQIAKWSCTGAIVVPALVLAGAAKSGAVHITPPIAAMAAVLGAVGGALLGAMRPWMKKRLTNFWLGWATVALAISALGYATAGMLFGDASIGEAIFGFVGVLLFGAVDWWLSKP